MGAPAQAPERLRSLVQIRRLTDNFIPQRDERIGREHDGIGRVCATDIPLRIAFQSVSSRIVTATSNFSVTRGETISNSNPASESNAARLGEPDASTSKGMATRL